MIPTGIFTCGCAIKGVRAVQFRIILVFHPVRLGNTSLFHNFHSLDDDRREAVRREVPVQCRLGVEALITHAAVEGLALVHGLEMGAQTAVAAEVVVTERTHKRLLP